MTPWIGVAGLTVAGASALVLAIKGLAALRPGATPRRDSMRGPHSGPERHRGVIPCEAWCTGWSVER